jgi:glycosyltransferase involved in cell wall biosynthesis
MPIPASQRPAQLLCVARLEEYKGIQLVIEALRKLPNAELTVVGDGSYRPRLEALAAEIPESRVRFAGYQPDPSAFYSEADIFIMPSLGPEGSSLGALEAMAYSLPCVLSDLPVYKELTERGKAALHFQRGDWADLRDKLSLLARDDQQRINFSRDGYLMVKQKYTAEVARQSYLQVFGIVPPATGSDV